MEAFAGFLSHTDHHLGRLIDHLDASGELDNTLVIVLSDNGASSEGGPVGSLNDARTWNAISQSVDEAWDRLDEIGGPRIHNNYPWGWTVAGNTPFRRWKREVHEGGVADPLLVHWPRHLAAPGSDGPGLRRQYVHAIDLAPTILEAAGIEPPTTIKGVAQRPIEGISFLPTMREVGADDRHRTQYYEMFACRAIYHDGWKAVTYHPIQDERPGIEQVEWELYDVRVDPSECDDLAEVHPERLRTLIDLWWSEAERHQVLPLDNRPFSELVFDRPIGVPPRHRYVYRPFTAMVPERMAVDVKNRPHVVRATVRVPPAGARGVIIAQGSVLGGWALYLTDDGRLEYAHNLSGKEQHVVSAAEPLTPGSHDLELRYGKVPESPKLAQLLVDGAIVAEGEIRRFTWSIFSLTGAGLCCGWAMEPAVSDNFVAPHRFTGELDPVVVEVEGIPVVDGEAIANAAITSQ
jgi:arylsulfatase